MADDFVAIETSVEQGRPIEFYRFVLGDVTWLYTSADHDEEFEGLVFKAAAIVSSNIKQTGEAISDVLQLDVPVWIAPAQLFMAMAAPTQPIQLTIAYKHFGGEQLVIGYNGFISNVNFPMPGRATIICESLLGSLAREGLRLGWQRSCPYVIYDPVTCKLNATTMKVDFRVLSIEDFTVGVRLVTDKPDAYFENGFIEWAHPVRGVERLHIEGHARVASPATDEPNAFFQVMTPPDDLFEGATGSAFPGCDFTPAQCTSYGNYDNYGGAPDLPGKSPFDGTPVF